MMLKFTFRQTIVLWTTTIIGIVILLIYIISLFSIHQYLTHEMDNRLSAEAKDIHRSLTIIDGKLTADFNVEWGEDHHRFESETSIYFLILKSDGSEFLRSDNLIGRDIPLDQLKFYEKESNKTTAPLNNNKIRFISVPLHVANAHMGWIVLGMSFDRINFIINVLIKIFLILYPVTIILVYMGSSVIASKALKPVMEISETARSLHFQNMDKRLPVPDSQDEFTHLAETMNQLLERVHNSIESIKEFTSNISHELKTPLSIIHLNLEKLKTQEYALDGYDGEKTLREVKHLAKTIDDLSALAKADSQQLTMKREIIWINDLIFEEIERFKSNLDCKHMEIKCHDIVSQSIVGDAHWVRTIISNLLDNAIKYSPENTTIQIGLDQRGNEHICLWVSDEGPGVDEAEIPSLVKRFYRHKTAQDTKGSGLGLSIVDWVVKEHRGELFFSNNSQGGLRVEVILPTV